MDLTKAGIGKFYNKEGMETVELENSMIGTLTIAGKESEKLGMFQLMVEGHKFSCQEKFREAFNEYLSSINVEKIKVTVLHSGKPLHVQSESDSARRKRKKFDVEKKAKKLRMIHYNCTVKVSKDEAQFFFDNYADRFQAIQGILQRGPVL